VTRGPSGKTIARRSSIPSISGPELISRLEGDPPPGEELEGIARAVAQAIYDAAKKRCLVLMPFGAGA